jgi:hypothetical protein
MSFQFNSDREQIKATNPSLIGSNELTIRSGSGSNEKEVLRAQLDSVTTLPRIGINRTGNRIDRIVVTSQGSGYTLQPTVTLSAPPNGGVQALASAVISDGSVVAILVDNIGRGYTSAPSVTITGGNGQGAAATAFLDTVDFELDINGAIRTSTSIISDTARILNLDIDNFVTPDAQFRAPNLKTYLNSGGTPWAAGVIIQQNQYRYHNTNVYQALNTGTLGSTPPQHTDGIELNGEVQLKHIGIRAVDSNRPYFNQGGQAGIFPRSITPSFGDKSDKIATTEYVLNLATNDVGGRIYVSEQIGSDLNDGRSAVNPVRTIKKAAQLAWTTPGVKETIVVSGGDYVEDNPISLPPDASVVGDNLRLVIIRPNNPRKHIFKFGDKNYVTGVTYRDKVDSNGDPVATWDYAMVFDDKQRIEIDVTANGDYGVDFPVGHQIFGPEKFRATYQTNTGLSQLTAGQRVRGVNTGAIGLLTDVTFTRTTGASAYVNGTVDFTVISGSFNAGETFQYGGIGSVSFAPNTAYTLGQLVWTGDNVYTITTAGTSASSAPSHTTGAVTNGTAVFTFLRAAYEFISTDIISIRAEGEVVFINEDVTSALPIVRIDFSKQGDPEVATGGFGDYGTPEDLGGIVFYTNALVGRQNTHNFKEGQEIFISNLPTSSPDLSFLNGKQRIYKVIEDADGRARRFVIPKKTTVTLDSNFDPGQFANVKSYSKSITLSLLNSPNKFPVATPVARRYQDACLQIRNNIDFIADEVVRKINDQFKREYFPVYGISGVQFKIYLGPSSFAHTYVSGGTVTFNGTAYNITGFTYDNVVTGEATITTSIPVASLVEDSVVRLAGIVVSCVINGVTTQKTYPSFNIPVSDAKCRRDIGHFLNAICRDLEFGSNYNVIDAAKKYISAGQIDLVDYEIIQTVRAIEYARELAIYAMRKWRTKNGAPSDPIYTPQYSSVTRYFDPTVIDDLVSPACANVASAINTLSYLFVDVLTNNASGTYLDGAYLIARNRDLIADQAYLATKTQYPSLGLSNLNESKCRRDINYIIDGLLRDLVLGGNAGIVTAAESYFTNTVLTGIPEAQRDETIYAFNQVRDLTIQAIRNWSGGTVATRTPTGATYNATTGVLTVTFPNPTTPVTTAHRLAFKEGALTFSCTSGSGGNLASPTPTDRNYGKSLTITNVSTAGGNTTVTVNVGDAGTASGATHTFVSALANGTIIIYNPVTSALTSPIPKYEDWNILLSSESPLCANVASSITTSFTLLEDILDGTIAPGATTKNFGTLYSTVGIVTYPDSTIYDADGVIYTPRSDYDDYPIIEASPYTQNASVISFLGGGGALIDGSKVKQPNCPFPGLELDGSATFPNQGKSMVAAAFTIVSFGGTGYRIINDGYVQLVSVFVIFCTDGVLAESGGYASITNSATNFGIFALRATGYNSFAYSFDVGTITNVSSTPTGRTIFTIDGLGREPLEHYVVKIDGYENVNPEIEYYIDTVGAVTVGPPFSAQVTIESGSGGPAEFKSIATGQAVSNSTLTGKTIRLRRPSIVNSSSHTWEFAGSGTNYNALPENGGVKIEAYEQVSENYGRTYVSGTDELGDFKVGTFARIENRTGNITFTGTVTISEVEFLKLKGGDVVVTGFDASNTLGGANSTDSKLPTQKAVRDYITNNLGPYINKPYSTNAVPRALVELTDSGKISIDQIPPLRPFSVFTVADQAARLAIEGALAGDIAIQQDTSASYILNNDNASLFVSFNVDPTLQFTANDVFTGSISGGKIQATEYRQGVVYQINITDPGSGYTSAPVITITGGTPQAGSVPASATCTIANGQVVTVTIQIFNGFRGGKGYTTPPTVTFSAPSGAGTQATGVALIESRLYGNIVNNIKITETDTIQSSDIPAETININRVVNTSASNNNNWVSLSTNQIAASDITSGVIATSRLANNSDAANSFTFLRGDQAYAPVVQSIKGAESRYFAKLFSQANSGSSQLLFTTNSNTLVGHEVVNNITGIQANTNISGVVTSAGITTVALNNPLTSTLAAGTIIEFRRGASPLVFESSFTQGGFVDNVVIASGGSGFTNGQYFDVPLSGGSGTGLRSNIIVTNGAVTEVTVTSSGTGYTADFNVSSAPAEIGGGSGLVLAAKINTVSRQYANTSLDIQRVTDLTISADEFGTIGVARFKKSQFLIGQSGNGSIVLKTGADSGLDADLLDGAQGSYYLNASNLNSGTVSVDRLSGTYNISISGQSGNTIRLLSNTTNPTSNPSPNAFSVGIVADTRNNSANGLSDGGTKNIVLSIRPGGSGFTVDGGVKQLAFTDNDNMWLRGSGTAVDTFGSWAKVWTSLNDGPGTGLDADRLDNRQGTWFQNAINMNFGTLSDNRLPSYQTRKDFQDTVRVLSFTGQPRYRIYIPDETLTASPFLPGLTVNLYNSLDQGTGVISITDVTVNNDTNDPFNNYTIITGTLTTGNFIGATSIGITSNKKAFRDFSIATLDSNADGIPDGSFVAATLESDGGTANLRLGRKDGQASSPGLYFNSSTLAATYNAAIVATGGNGSTSSGTLDVKVVNANGFTLNGNTIWNAGNVTFNSTNVVSTAVIRDASGNFAAGTITANLTGAASANVLKAGDTMTGSLTLTGAGSNLSVSGTLGVTGNTTLTANLIVDTNTLYVQSTDNLVGIGLVPSTAASTNSKLQVYGGTLGSTDESKLYLASFEAAVSNYSRLLIYNRKFNTTFTDWRSASTRIQQRIDVTDQAYIEFNPEGSEYGLALGTQNNESLRLIQTGEVGIRKTPSTGYNLDVSGKGRFSTSLEIRDASDNSGASMLFLGSSGFRNFRIGNQLVGNDIFEITPSTAAGGSTWATTPALAIQGSTSRVGLGTTTFSSTATGATVNYQLNVQGNININGTVYQNNLPFVTSRWTQSTNGTDIHRLSRVGIGVADPTWTLQVGGSGNNGLNIQGTNFSSGVNNSVLYANGDRQWLDSFGIFKSNRNNVSENVTIPNGANTLSSGSIVINSGVTVTVQTGGTWNIV